MSTKLNFFWHRRDLRIEDNRGLSEVLSMEGFTQPVFIFDEAILDPLEDKSDARVTFIYGEIERLKKEYEEMGATLLVAYGNPKDVWNQWLEEYSISNIVTNEDYEPYARERDDQIKELALAAGTQFSSFKDHVIFEKNEVTKEDGAPYVVYTPYSKIWKKRLTPNDLAAAPSKERLSALFKSNPAELLILAEMGFRKSALEFPSVSLNEGIVATYDETRDIPSVRGTTRMSLHLRFGTVSIRFLARRARALNEKYLNELIWRDFYQSILYHFPHVDGQSFRPEYEAIEWENDEKQFQAWCDGKTGYPIVDAGMRELNTTGFMHNRVRMIVASFLTKHLLIDWRWGEAYFAQKLLDFELASNNGGWQWAAGCGVDAAPYFRVFNPELQMKKFDPEMAYVRKWVPEYQELHYRPIVDHKMARLRAIERYKKGIEKGRSRN